jgi:ubiquinone/menaquinone biosynthesis C-methylase UbiE
MSDKKNGFTISTSPRMSQAKKPSGWLGRLLLRNMNSRHSHVTDWGLSHITVGAHDTILDVGCGGGRTVSKLAALATQGKVYGVDFSRDSVAVASKTNRSWIETGHVEIHEGSVSQLPFADNMFDLITAVETHFWWPDLPADMREVMRVLKPGGTLAVIAEVYRGANSPTARLVEKYLPQTGLKLLTSPEHRDLLAQAGCIQVEVSEEPRKGWICAVGKKPGTQ